MKLENSTQSSAEALPRSESFPSQKAKTVLLVDDDEIAGQTLALMIETAGCRVIRVENGIDALSAINSSPIDLVITDLCIPYMSGLEIIDYIRRAAKALPVFLITGYVDGFLKEQQQEIERLQISEVLIKPVHLKPLTELIRRYLDLGLSPQ